MLNMSFIASILKDKLFLYNMMRRIFLMVLCLVLFAPMDVSGQEETKETLFSKGIEAYSAGDYEKAVEEWTAIYKTGNSSAELCYNIGNAYFKLNNIPGSILFFERAALLDPSDEDINYNLQIARTLVVDRFEEIPELFFVGWAKLLALSLRSNSWAIISIVTFVLCLLLVALYFFTPNYKLKVSAFWIAVFLLLVSLLSLSCSVKSKNMVYHSESAIIYTPQVKGKSSPDDSGTDLFVLHEGTKVGVTDKVGDWLEIRLSDGNKGWVPASSLEII